MILPSGAATRETPPATPLRPCNSSRAISAQTAAGRLDRAALMAAPLGFVAAVGAQDTPPVCRTPSPGGKTVACLDCRATGTLMLNVPRGPTREGDDVPALHVRSLARETRTGRGLRRRLARVGRVDSRQRARRGDRPALPGREPAQPVHQQRAVGRQGRDRGLAFAARFPGTRRQAARNARDVHPGESGAARGGRGRAALGPAVRLGGPRRDAPRPHLIGSGAATAAPDRPGARPLLFCQDWAATTLMLSAPVPAAPQSRSQRGMYI